MESLKLLLSNNIEVGIHYLVTKTNLKELSSTANALFQLGIHDFKPLKLVFQGHAFDKKHGPFIKKKLNFVSKCDRNI